MGTEPQTPEDLDEGEPQPYEYPSSLDTATEPAYEIEDCAANKLSRVRMDRRPNWSTNYRGASTTLRTVSERSSA